MKNATRKWLEFARKDLNSGEILFQGKAYEGAIYHCHQAIEKILKAIVTEKEIKLRKTHDLVGLIADAKISLPQNIISFIEELNPYYQPIRYPDAFLESKTAYSRLTTKTILKKTQETIKWIENLII